MKQPKYFLLLMNGRLNSVSIDRLKVAHLPTVKVNPSTLPTNSHRSTTFTNAGPVTKYSSALNGQSEDDED